METFKRDFIKYFNVDLKSYLEYSETFTVEFYSDRIILKPNRQSQLINIIKTDKQLKDKLLSQLTNNIKKVFPTVYDVSFNTDKEGNLIVKFDTQRRVDFGGLVGVAAQVASTLDEKSLDEFCRTSTEFRDTCKKPEFWITLIKIRFPEYFKEFKGGYPLSRPAYNWEKVYKGLLFYDNFRNNIDQYKEYSMNQFKIFDFHIPLPINLWNIMTNKYSEAVKYLILEDIIPLSKEDLKHILSFTADVDIHKYIFDKYKINNEILNDAFSNAIGNIELMKIYLDYKDQDESGNPVELDKSYVEDIYEYLIDHDERDVSIEEWKLFYEKIEDPAKRYTPDSLLQALIDLGSSPDPKTVEYIIKMLPDEYSQAELINWFRDAIRAIRAEQIGQVWGKYRALFDKDDIEELRQEIKNEFSDEYNEKDTADELLNIIK